MKIVKVLSLYVIILSVFFQCQEAEFITPQADTSTVAQVGPTAKTASTIMSQYQTGSTYYVGTTGNDGTGDGSSAKPWRTLRHAVTRVAANQGHTIKLSAGTFVEAGAVNVPLGVNIEGAGKGQTILKAASSFYYKPSSPAYAPEKFLLSLAGYNAADGKQILKNFSIDGDSKQLHAGIYVRYRNKVIIDQVAIQNVNFTAIWLWDVKDAQIINSDVTNSSWGSSAYCVGAINLGNLERVEIANVNINESTGYGIKAIGPSGYNNITELKIHDSRVSVHPYGLWNGGSAPNIAIELWQVNLVRCEIYNTYVDNTISLVNSNAIPSTGIQTIRVHHNILDMETRSGGSGYGVELTLHDAEIDNNYFIKGTYGIANWDNPMKNWYIHHNVFYGLSNTYPGDIVRSQWSGLHNVKLYNNTIEFTGTKTMNVVGVYGGASNGIDIKNNLIINSNTGYSYYQNQLVHKESSASVSNLTVQNNHLSNLDLNVGGLNVLSTSYGNLTGDPKITKTGSRPTPYYVPATGSPLINKGVNVGYPYSGTSPDIGAYESGATTQPAPNAAPQVSITSPSNAASFSAGSSISINANATDSDGSISKVEFFNGSTKLGEDASSPYSFLWNSVAAGSYTLTAKATDNAGATKISNGVAVSVAASSTTNKVPTISLTSPANYSSYTTGTPVTISATAADSDGSIVKVEFYNGSSKIGEDLYAPYSFAFTTSVAGTYTLSARAVDNKGSVANSAASTITMKAPTTSTPPSTTGFMLNLDASQATRSGKMVLQNDAQGVSYFAMPVGSGKNYYLPAPSSASYTFQVPTTGTYVMWVKMKTPTPSNQGYHIYDGKGRWTMWQAGIHTSWTWVKVPVNFSFSQGSNSIQFGWLDENAQVDKLVITNNLTFTPTN